MKRKREEREEERERSKIGIEPSLSPPMVEIHQGSDELGGTGDRDEWGVIHLDGRERMEDHSWMDFSLGGFGREWDIPVHCLCSFL